MRYGLREQGRDIVGMYEATRAKGFGKEVRRRVMIGTYVLSAGYYDAYYLRAQKVRTLIKKDFEDCFNSGVQAILTPATPSAAFGIGEKGGADPIEMYLNDVFTVTVNMAGPAGDCGAGRPVGGEPAARAAADRPAIRGRDAVLARSCDRAIGRTFYARAVVVAFPLKQWLQCRTAFLRADFISRAAVVIGRSLLSCQAQRKTRIWERMEWKGPTVTSEDIRELVHKSYAAYDNGDHDFIVNLFDDNIEWKYYSSPEAIPFPNNVRGKLQVLMALKTVDDLFEIIGNTLELVMVDGDRAAVICDQKVRQRATGRIIRTKVAAFHRYRDGRLIEYTAFADSLDIMQQTLGRLIELPEIYPKVE